HWSRFTLQAGVLSRRGLIGQTILLTRQHIRHHLRLELHRDAVFEMKKLIGIARHLEPCDWLFGLGIDHLPGDAQFLLSRGEGSHHHISGAGLAVNFCSLFWSLRGLVTTHYT